VLLEGLGWSWTDGRPHRREPLCYEASQHTETWRYHARTHPPVQDLASVNPILSFKSVKIDRNSTYQLTSRLVVIMHALALKSRAQCSSHTKTKSHTSALIRHKKKDKHTHGIPHFHPSSLFNPTSSPVPLSQPNNQSDHESYSQPSFNHSITSTQLQWTSVKNDIKI
jgi:hypothetical protein